MTVGRRIILHLDMDAFYAAIEQRDDPSLRGRPVIVGGRARRGVVCTASYEARPTGVRSAMPMVEALRRCPEAVVVPPRMGHYLEVSAQVMAVMRTFSPVVEPLSLDEAFLDMTGTERLFGAPREMAAKLRAEIRARTTVGDVGLTGSVGIAGNKFLAKLASDLDKPDGVTEVPVGDEAAFIAPLDLRRLWGVGPRAHARLQRLGLATIGDLAAADARTLEVALGARHAHHLLALARGEDARAVVPDRGRKSMGSESTLAHDVRGHDAVRRILRRQCLGLAAQLRARGSVAGGVRVKLRYSETFALATRQQALAVPADDGEALLEAAEELLPKLDLERPIRLVGAAAFDLTGSDAPRQYDLFEAPRRERRVQLERTVDAIRGRFGDKIDFGD